MPFVARHATHAPTETRARLGLPPTTIAGWRCRRSAATASTGIDLDALDLDARRGTSCAVPDAAIYDAGLRYEDLVRAVDVVLTKPGYGIISECIANDTAMVYTSRGRFAGIRRPRARDAALPALRVSGQRRAARGPLARGARRRGRRHRRRRESPRTDGADVIADMICRASRRLPR